MIIAKCIRAYDKDPNEPYKYIKEGTCYELAKADINQLWASVSLKQFEGKWFNVACFEFYKDGERINLKYDYEKSPWYTDRTNRPELSDEELAKCDNYTNQEFRPTFTIEQWKELESVILEQFDHRNRLIDKNWELKYDICTHILEQMRQIANLPAEQIQPVIKEQQEFIEYIFKTFKKEV